MDIIVIQEQSPKVIIVKEYKPDIYRRGNYKIYVNNQFISETNTEIVAKQRCKEYIKVYNSDRFKPNTHYYDTYAKDNNNLEGD